MKKHFTKLICLIVAIACSVSAFAGCAPNQQNNVDNTKTQLTVGLVNNGYGSSWMYNAIDRFEEQFKDYTFEPGTDRKGVEVHVIPVEYASTLESTLQNVNAEVIFSQNGDYNSFAKSGKMKDITSIVKGSLEEFGETGSLEDKMPESTAQAYQIDGKYYSLPFVISSTSFIYDMDVFDDYGLYFAADTEKTSTTDPSQNYPAKKVGNNYVFLSKTNTVKSAGPNGVIGDYDDGLPATFDQFFALTKRMQNTGVIPFTAAGAFPSYITYFMDSLWANCEGAENYALYQTMSGTATDLVDMSTLTDSGTFSLKPATEITEENAWLLYSQAGRYYALDFLERLIDDTNNYVDRLAFGKTVNHLDAQTNFMASRHDDEKPTAMLIEGMYWENEATSAFLSMERYNTAEEKWGKKDRRFGFMPFPHQTEAEIGQKNVLVGGTSELVFINGYSDESKMDVAGKFLQFCHTDVSLREFSIETSLMRPFGDYMTSEATERMSNYGKSVYDVVKDSEFVNYPFCDTYLLNYARFHHNPWSATVGGSTVGDPSTEIHNGVSAVDYFKGLVNYTPENVWKNSVYKG